MLNKTEKRVLDALEPIAVKHNIEIVTVEIIGSKKSPVVRIYIDTLASNMNATDNANAVNNIEAPVSEASENAHEEQQDTAELQKGSISFDELAASQAWISDELDVLDPFSGSYTLEVSSPGIDRPLRTPAHFNAYKGKIAVLKLKGRINSRSTLKGEISHANENEVVLRIDEQDISIPLANIKRAYLQGEISFK